MQENYIIIAIVAVILIVLVSLFIVVANLQKTVVVRVRESQQADNAKITTIEELLDIVAKRKTSRNDLVNAILRAAKECPFPKKERGIAPAKSKIYLNFILLMASHPNADAKLIAFMDEELKKTNPEYKSEIDIYENEGINQRGNRV